MSFYYGESVIVGDGYMYANSGHTSFRHDCAKPGMWSVNVMGYPFNFSADAVVDDFGSLVRVGG